MKREAPYKYIQYAASRGWMRFDAPGEDALSKDFKKKFRLESTEIVRTSVFDDVAARTASTILRLFRERRRSAKARDEVHIGFAGGHAMRMVAQKLADSLKEPAPDLPHTVFFHALVAGFDVDAPGNDPSAFFAYFDHPAIRTQIKVRFLALHAPSIVEPGQMGMFLDLPGVKDVHERISDLDIIVTSASSLSDGHSMLRRYYAGTADSMIEKLKKDGCTGDMLWLPLSPSGPVDIGGYPYRALTLVDLDKMPGYIQQGMKVVLALGPCGLCGHLKNEILSTILHLKESLITHLVVDSRTIREFMRPPK
jgi:DNA-binding transcriptional regulator LsrR (DeoR family)